MRRVVIGLTLATVALGGAWVIRAATRGVVLPEVNNARAERGQRPQSFRCDSPSSENAAEVALRGVESELYWAIIRGAPHTNIGNPLVVERLTIQVPAHRRFEKWDGDASSLLLDGIAQCVVLRAEQFPPGVNFINTSEVEKYSQPRMAAHDVPDQVFAFSRVSGLSVCVRAPCFRAPLLAV